MIFGVANAKVLSNSGNVFKVFMRIIVASSMRFLEILGYLCFSQTTLSGFKAVWVGFTSQVRC